LSRRGLSPDTELSLLGVAEDELEAVPLNLTGGRDGPRLAGESALPLATEEEPVGLLELELGAGRKQHPVNVERRGRGRVITLAKHD
jgi:hypothetical protein